LSRRVRRPVAVAAVLVLVAVLTGAVVGYVVWQRGGALEQAARLLPDGTLRVTWTDWDGVRSELGADDVTGAEAAGFLQEATDRDLASSSPTAASAELIDEAFGFSPLASEWELLGQSPEGMVLVYRLAEGTDLAAVAGKAEEIGFREPGEDRLSGGVWEGGPDVITNVEGLSAPELQHLSFLEEDRLLVASDNAGYLRSAMPVVTGEEDGLDLSALAGQAEDPLSAVALASDHACAELSMSAADEGAQATADQLVEDAGGVSPLTGYLAALLPGGRMSVVFGYENDDQAERDARSRGALAGAEDPGQLVAYPELFHVDEVRADGEVVVIDAEVVAAAFPLSNLTQGPVLLASC
jgi:hypothetical protein